MSTEFYKRIKIKDCTYTIFLMDGDASLTAFGTLAKYLGGPLGYLLARGPEGQVDPAVMALALKELGSAIGQPDMRALIYQMLDGVTVKADSAPKAMLLIENGVIETYKQHFRGKIGDQLQLALFALKENFSNFSEALPGVAALVQQLPSQGQLQFSPADTAGKSAS